MGGIQCTVNYTSTPLLSASGDAEISRSNFPVNDRIHGNGERAQFLSNIIDRIGSSTRSHHFKQVHL
jgi:hypothetical protein